MTACVNDNQKKGGYGKAVSATLAGVLAVGMVPATALAADGDAVVASDGGMNLLVGEGQWVSQSTVTKAEVAGTSTENLSNLAFTVDSTPTNWSVIPEQITYGGEEIDIWDSAATPSLSPSASDFETGFSIEYWKADKTAATKVPGTNIKATQIGAPSATSFTTAGTYYAVVKYASGTDTGQTNISWTVSNQSLAKATVFNAAGGNTDSTKTTFTYTGAAQTPGFALNGTVLTDTGATPDYTVQYSKVGTDGVLTAVTSVKDAGNYVAVLTGANAYAGSSAKVEFEVKQLDLSSPDVTVEGGATGPVVKVNGTVITNPASPAAPIYVATITGAEGETAPFTYGANTTYTYTIAAGEGNNNVTGSKSVSFAKVANAVTFLYNSGPWPTTEEVIDLAADEALEAITAEYGAGPTTVPPKQVQVTITDASGNTVTAATLNSTPGTYTVVATVDGSAAAIDYEYGGTNSMKVKVVDGAITGVTDVYATYAGVPQTSSPITKEYTGKNLLGNLEVTIKCGDKTLVEGTDYTIEVKDASNNVVTEAVNVGTYTMSFKSNSYDMTNAGTVVLKINPITVTSIKVANTIKVSNTELYALPLVGDEVTPVIMYQTNAGDVSDPTSDNAKWAVLPAEYYTLSYRDSNGTKVAKLDTAGDYAVSVMLNTAVKPANFSFGATTTTLVPYNATSATAQTYNDYLTIYDGNIFADVPASAWYFEDVYDAANAGYMTGIGGTSVFGPDRPILRSDVAVVLYRMVSGKTHEVVSGQTVVCAPLYATPFADVDNTDMYYYNAVGWAKQAGIVNGFGGSNLYRPAENVTREQFCKMMFAYAKATDNYTAPTKSASEILGSFPDAASVSGWAQEAVAWAVNEGLFGSNGTLDPQGKVTRAQVAKITSGLQPEAIPMPTL